MYNYRDDTIPLAHQYIALKQYTNGRVQIKDNDRTIYWEGKITPQPFSRSYNVVIRYSIGSDPKCIVTSPNLEELVGDRKIPHIYSDDENIPGTVLCLYLPRIKGKNNIPEWLPSNSIASTLVPWASLWLGYFEEWLHSNHWQGGGEHPAPEVD